MSLSLPKTRRAHPVDHQIGLMTGVRGYSIALLKHNVVALAKAARALRLPLVVTTARDSM